MAVKVRYRKVSNERYNIYLDYYFKDQDRRIETLKGYVVTKDYGKQKRKRFANKQDQEYVLMAEARASEENKKLITGIPPLRKDIDLYTFLDKVIDKSKDSKKQAFKRLKTNLEKFQITPINMRQISVEWLEDFKAFLEEKHKPSTTDTYLGRMKILLDKACDASYLERSPFPRKGIYLNQNSDEKDINDYLTFEELTELNKVQFDSNLCRAFLFSCFTGLRLSDVERLTRDNIIGDEVHIVQYKTRKKKPKANTIPLSDEALRILNSLERKSDRVFNLPSRGEISTTLKLWANSYYILITKTSHTIVHSHLV
jgi:integrase